jgi:signal transduction histidine kinase
MMDAVAGFATLVWPPSGIALAALLIFGNRLWPGVLIGAFTVNVWTGAPIPVALAMGVGNTLEAVLGAYALRRFAGFRLPFDRVRHAIGLIALAALLSTTVSATIGCVALRLGGIVRPGHFVQTWRAWWVGDALGDLVVAPLLLAWSQAPSIRFRSIRFVEVAALGASLIAVGFLVFVGAPDPGRIRQIYMTFPLLIWAALRFGLRGATLVTFLLSAIAVACTAVGLGPFVRSSLSENLLDLQVFMAVAAATALLLGAAISERAADMRRREEFVSIVSHDLKNPLSAIMMSARVMKKHVARPDAISKQVVIVERAAERMHSLIRDLLELAAIDAGRLSLDLAMHDAGALISEAVELTRPLATEKSLTIQVPPSGVSISVECDRNRILQVLVNLVDNAIKFTPDQGNITVRVDQVNGRVQFAVADTGPGIGEEQLRHIFERFWQTQPGAREGSGLGLSIVRGIVEAHGGRVWVVSRLGEGSTFYFTLRASAPST